MSTTKEKDKGLEAAKARVVEKAKEPLDSSEIMDLIQPQIQELVRAQGELEAALQMIGDKIGSIDKDVEGLRAFAGPSLPREYVEGITHQQVFLTALQAALKASLDQHPLATLSRKKPALGDSQAYNAFAFAERVMQAWLVKCNGEPQSEVE